VAIAKVQDAVVDHTGINNEASLSVSFGSNVTAGNTIIVSAFWNAGSTLTFSITDSLGNTYTSAVGPHRSADGFTLQCQVFKVFNISSGGACTITGTPSAVASNMRLHVSEWSGIGTTVDQSAGTTGTTTQANSGSVTTTSASELIYAFGVYLSSNTTADTGSGYSAFTNTTTGPASEYQIASSTGTFSGTFNTVTSQQWVAEIVTFPAASGGGGTPGTGIGFGSNHVNIFQKVEIVGY